METALISSWKPVLSSSIYILTSSNSISSRYSSSLALFTPHHHLARNGTVSAHFNTASPSPLPYQKIKVPERVKNDCFASLSSYISVKASPIPQPTMSPSPSLSNFGLGLFSIGVGVGVGYLLPHLISWVASNLKVKLNGFASYADEFETSEGSSSFGQKTSGLSVEALEKLMEDPTVQKLLYEYIPEDTQNPTFLKWMLQYPQCCKLLEDMLNDMGRIAWDNRMKDLVKNFDLSSPEVKQQFDQIGLSPEEVVAKIIANPDVAMAFENPRVQAAILDCSDNPLSIINYQKDQEVMNFFDRLTELFPGVTGSLWFLNVLPFKGMSMLFCAPGLVVKFMKLLDKTFFPTP